MRTLLGITVFSLCALSASVAARAGDVAETNAASTLIRDPFWPVDWVPPPPLEQDVGGGTNVPKRVVKVEQVRWAEAQASLQQTGYSKGRDGKYFAILKGIGVVQEGDTVSVTFAGKNYSWKIVSVTEKGIVLERGGMRPAK
jgi:hypothetical protein